MKIFRNYKKILTIPNLISLIRIVLSLVLSYLALIFKTNFLLILYLVLATTDFLDGFMARKLKQESVLGATLDEVGDFVCFSCAAIFIYAWRPDVLVNNFAIFGIILFLSVFPPLLIYILKGRFFCLHLYSRKFWAYVGGFAFIYYVVFKQQSQTPLYIFLIYTLLTFIEEMVVIFRFRDKLHSNMGSLFLMKKEKRGAGSKSRGQ